MKFYKAPWSKLLIITSSLVTALGAGIAIGFIWSGHEVLTWVAALPIAIVAGSALFMIRGYTVTANALLIHRLFWTTRLPLGCLESVLFEPDAMRGSIRLCGNGGLFSFTGLFRNKTLGNYHAFATDLRRTVVLRFPSRTVVVSPAAPETFALDIAASSHAA
ncbi:MAG: PH domain-containing protein [Cyanobacteria bacterium]|nr:PH domain-containing protein [Cyanobacteriota bacterium]